MKRCPKAGTIRFSSVLYSNNGEDEKDWIFINFRSFLSLSGSICK
jgi:hypothetical protein